MPSTIRFKCPCCSARIKAPSQLLGKKRNCPQCGHYLTVRGEPPEDSGPILMGDGEPAPRRRRLSAMH
jgi:hypothetical protein